MMTRLFPFSKLTRIHLLVLGAASVRACDESDSTDVATDDVPADDAGFEPDAAAAPAIELTPEICDDPSNLQAVLIHMSSRAGFQAQLEDETRRAATTATPRCRTATR